MLGRLYTSRTIIGALVLLLSMLTRSAGLDFDEGKLTEYAQMIVDLGGLGLVIYGRLKARGPIL